MKIDYQKLRKLAEIARDGGTYQEMTDYRTMATPQLVLALIEEIEDQGKRIVDLEARIVDLPQRLQPGADGYDDWYMHSADDGEYFKADEVIAAIYAAGIRLKEATSERN